MGELGEQFKKWIEVKIELDRTNKGIYFKEGQIWWVSLGQNIGVESNGKHKYFERPTIVIKKFNRDCFWAVAVSGKTKKGEYYYKFDFRGKNLFVNLSQLRILSCKRMLRLAGNIDNNELSIIKRRLGDILKTNGPLAGASELPKES